MAQSDSSESPLLIKTVKSTEQGIPLIVLTPDHQKAIHTSIRFRWDLSDSIENGPIVFSVENSNTNESAQMLKARLWTAALSSAMVWQQPWLASHWTIRNIPEMDGSGISAALGVGLIATASRVLYPKDTVILGDLNPDGSLSPVSQLKLRIEAAAKAGIKRVIIPTAQRIDADPNGSYINIHQRTQDLGMQCILVDNLAEATERILNRKLPDAPSISTSPRYDGSISQFLDRCCKKEMQSLQNALRNSPRPNEQAALPSFQQKLWKQITALSESGQDAYQSGLLYVGNQLFVEANAKYQVIQAHGKSFDYRTYQNRATSLRQKIQSLMSHSPFDKGDLQSALVLGEQLDWLYGLNAQLEGAQLIAKQAFGPRSDATADQKNLAQQILLRAVEQCSYELQNENFYSELNQQIKTSSENPPSTRSELWIQQLIPAHLAAAEFLNKGITERATILQENLIFDPRLATYARALRDAKYGWEQQIKQRDIAAAEKMTAEKIGFIPGAGYRTPEPPIPPSTLEKLSNTARCVNWVNDFCETAILEQKYIHFNGIIQGPELEFKIQNRAALQNMLRVADFEARQGIEFAKRVNLNPSILALIFERAKKDLLG